ncbi:histone H1-like isoform X1 [Boleophthalmus pectinirostris]|uniref:histone H1-like isoform X1 n=1 Tax=Boleophthalmus pectinirostris TaxID=150288 RepID=UPI00242D5B64|nr:histone H1-like isoform X1 [Boleophthalmus pectinirostris]
MTETVPTAAPATAKPKAPRKKAAGKKKEGPSLQKLITGEIAASKERKGVSVAALKKALAAKGVDVTKANKRINSALKRLVTSGAVSQTKGTGASGSFKLAKKEVKPKTVKKKAAAKPKKPAAKKAASPKKKTTVKKPAAKKPKSPAKKAVKKAAPKKAAAKKPAKSPKKAAPKKPKAVKKSPKKAPAKKAAPKKAKKRRHVRGGETRFRLGAGSNCLNAAREQHSPIPFKPRPFKKPLPLSRAHSSSKLKTFLQPIWLEPSRLPVNPPEERLRGNSSPPRLPVRALQPPAASRSLTAIGPAPWL